MSQMVNTYFQKKKKEKKNQTNKQTNTKILLRANVQTIKKRKRKLIC